MRRITHRWFFLSALMLAAVFAPAALGAAGDVEPGAMAQALGYADGAKAPAQGDLPPDFPCEFEANRTVEPHQVMVNELVHVHIEVNGSCDGGSVGMDGFLVVDRSITMQEEGYLNDTKQALKDFVNRMDFNKGELGLITFAGSEQVNRGLTDNRDALLAAINAIRLSEETDTRGLDGAFRTATQQVDRDGTPGNDKFILVVVAGPDQQQALVNMPTVTQAARNAGVRVIFLMFPNARFLHYVEASTDCTLSICPPWGLPGGPQQKWAWPVDQSVQGQTIDDRLQMLADVMFRAVDYARIEVNDFVHDGAEVISNTVQPPPDLTGPQPYLDMYWEYPGFPQGGITIDYDARMVDADEVYPVTLITEVDIEMSDGTMYTVPLPNPMITVTGMVTPTATPTTAVSPTDTPTGVPTTPVPSDTPDDIGGNVAIFLPLTLNGEVIIP